jgi:hypothetical protein
LLIAQALPIIQAMGKQDAGLIQWIWGKEVFFAHGPFIQELLRDQLVLDHRKAMPFWQFILVNWVESDFKHQTFSIFAAQKK